MEVLCRVVNVLVKDYDFSILTLENQKATLKDDKTGAVLNISLYLSGWLEFKYELSYKVDDYGALSVFKESVKENDSYLLDKVVKFVLRVRDVARSILKMVGGSVHGNDN